MKQEKQNRLQRQRRRFRVRNRIKLDSTRPRMSVFRSLKHIYVQIVDDATGKTLASASSNDRQLKSDVAYGGNCDAARLVGRAIAERALAAGLKQVVFDRAEYKYHGRVAALADAARDAGLDLGPKKVEPVQEEEVVKPAKSKKKK
ncbi:MAG: 50S ribosomal protein L18 [Thermoguttaceae bacterium]